MPTREERQRERDRVLRTVAKALAAGMSHRKAALEFGVSVGTVNIAATLLRHGVFAGIQLRRGPWI